MFANRNQTDPTYPSVHPPGNPKTKKSQSPLETSFCELIIAKVLVLPSRVWCVWQSRPLGRRPVRHHSGCHLPRGSAESCTQGGHWTFPCTRDDCTAAAWKDKVWSLLRRPAHTDGWGCRMNRGGYQEELKVCEAGRANNPLKQKAKAN